MKVSTSERLKQLMIENNYRQVDILNKCEPYCKKLNIKIGRSDLSQYISGKVEPRQDKLTVLAKALGVTESWLMGYDTAKEPIQLNSKYIGSTLMDFVEKDKDFIMAFLSLSQEDQNHIRKIAFALSKIKQDIE